MEKYSNVPIINILLKSVILHDISSNRLLLAGLGGANKAFKSDRENL